MAKLGGDYLIKRIFGCPSDDRVGDDVTNTPSETLR